jgi:hypothetical protein
MSSGQGSRYNKLFKNFLHNTLKLTKDDIREWTEAAIERIVERKVDVYLEKRFGDYDVQRLVDKAIMDKGKYYWGDSSDSFGDYVKKKVVAELLTGVKLKVDVVKTKKAATDGVKVMTVTDRALGKKK